MPDIEPLVLLDGAPDGAFPGSYRFSGYAGTLTAYSPAEVQPLLAELEVVTSGGMHAVGFLAYEAASAINPALPSLPTVDGLPLAWFALYRERHESQFEHVGHSLAPLNLNPVKSQKEHAVSVDEIRALIAAGELYQLNFTFPLSGRTNGPLLPLYRRLISAQRPSFGAFLETDRFAILSASPELFFALRGRKIVTRPMKGTAPRGRFPAEDRELKDSLCRSSKEQAENLMIVDLLRNDLGMVAETGSVQVQKLFACETYPTLHQLTSTVSAVLHQDVGLSELLSALFPCGSITGAPKKRSMEHIALLEGAPRGIYCGAIGHLGPGEATFSVAIRTLLVDRASGAATLGVGSGITWDSDPSAEYAECLNKGEFLATPAQPRLIESLRLENGCYKRIERHLDRLTWSASRLGYRFDKDRARARLTDHASSVAGIRKVRMLLCPDGEIFVESHQLPDNDSRPLKIAIASEKVDSSDYLIYLKTDQRQRFERARAEHPEVDELLFCNLQGDLTEGTYHSLVLRLGERLVTPPLTSGLLPGVMRQELLDSGEIVEQHLTPADLGVADEILLINSVRGWRRAIYVETATTAHHPEN